jgi:DNA-binding transcriptional LysR family regulator
MHIIPPGKLLRTRLKTRQLLLLIALDEQRNIHRAADELHMTQPAASKQLKDLEDMLEVKLFERLSHGMEPTLYGTTMIRHARMAVTSLSLAHEDIAVLKSGLSGQVAIGAIMSPGMALLPRAISRVKQSAPLMRIGVEVENSNVLLNRLRRGTLDFLVARILEDEARSELHYEELASEAVCVVARVGHPYQDAAALQLEDIARSPWVLPPHGSVLRHRCDTMFHCAGLIPPDNVVETTALLLIISLLLHSDSLHLMPCDVAAYFARHGILAILPIAVSMKMDGFGLITRRNYLLSPSAAVLLDAIRAASKEVY